MRDAMLIAEVSLYCTLLKNVCGKPDFASDGSCEKFTPWKQKWGYLLGERLDSVLREDCASC